MSETDFGSCRCGSGWFRLDFPDDMEEDEYVEPAVCIDLDGEITGYSGKLVCVDCGADWDPTFRFARGKGHLRLVVN